MRILIVDDEPIARRVLREEVELVPGVRGIEEAGDGIAALETIRRWRPDVVLLDLQMPGLTGFDVIARIDTDPLPVIIIVTAYDQHAIQAFEAGAIDYLLKPVSADRLASALERASRLLGNRAAIAERAALLHTPRKIVGRLGEEYFLLAPEEVLAFQADGDIVWIITARQRYQSTATLKVLQEKLQGLPFQRIHRSALVNVTHVRKMAALSSSRWLLTLVNSQEFIVSKRQAKAVRDILSW
jgi:DNA-binding LytR/AlgR family response regulator